MRNSVLAILLATCSATAPGQGSPADREQELFGAAERGDAATVRQRIADGVAADAVNARGSTALIAAVQGNHVEVAKLLVQAGADVNRQDAEQQSAFLIAAGAGNPELLRLMLGKGADVNRPDGAGSTALIRAAAHGQVEAVKALLNTPVKLDHVNLAGRTALLEAIVTGDGSPRYGQIVLLLSAAGADVNIADKNRVAPLDHARRRGYDAMAGVLEHAGAR
ncbi:MAG: ankyrin repeat domain-containing protein [Acidobacteriota bacterium]